MMGLALGLVFGAALYVAFRSIVTPAPRGLAQGLEALHAERRLDTVTERRRIERVTEAVTTVGFVDRLLVPLRSDIEVAGLSDAGFVADFTARAGAGFILGVGLVFGLNRTSPLSPVVMAVVVLFFVVVGALSAVFDVREKASVRRQEFLEAMVAFIEFVRLGSTFRPLEGATAAGVKVGEGWPFEVLAAAMEDSHRFGEPVWAGLARLGRQYQLSDLEELANTLALGQAEGASLASSLAARSRALRSRLLAEEVAEANRLTETLQAPVTLLAILFFLFLLVPAGLVLTGNG